jgi:hypothetical protein
MERTAEPYTWSDWALILALAMALIEILSPVPTFGTTIAMAGLAVAIRLSLYLAKRFTPTTRWGSIIVPTLILLAVPTLMIAGLIYYANHVAAWTGSCKSAAQAMGTKIDLVGAGTLPVPSMSGGDYGLGASILDIRNGYFLLL